MFGGGTSMAFITFKGSELQNDCNCNQRAQNLEFNDPTACRGEKFIA